MTSSPRTTVEELLCAHAGVEHLDLLREFAAADPLCAARLTQREDVTHEHVAVLRNAPLAERLAWCGSNTPGPATVAALLSAEDIASYEMETFVVGAISDGVEHTIMGVDLWEHIIAELPAAAIERCLAELPHGDVHRLLCEQYCAQLGAKHARSVTGRIGVLAATQLIPYAAGREWYPALISDTLRAACAEPDELFDTHLLGLVDGVGALLADPGISVAHTDELTKMLTSNPWRGTKLDVYTAAVCVCVRRTRVGCSKRS